MILIIVVLEKSCYHGNYVTIVTALHKFNIFKGMDNE